jgi:hypothetical protein
MLKPAKCPNCGGALQIPDNQTVYKCFYCGSEFFVESALHTASPTPPPALPPTPALAEPEARVKVDFAGVWVALDVEVKVFLDNQLIGVGSVKKGFSFVFNTTAGKHVLELKTSVRNKSYDFEISSAGNYHAQITYSRTWGNFSSDLNFARF